MENLNHYPNQLLLLALMFVLTFQSCTKDEVNDNPINPQTYERGEISKTTSLGTFTPNDILQIFDAVNVDVPFTLAYTVEVLSVNYYTVDKDGNEVLTSGAFLIPQNAIDLPLMSMQHGTESKSDLVASVSPNNSTEGIIGLLTASMGYFTIIPDYLGFGVSNQMHPYMHNASIVPCIIDFMIAGNSYCSTNNIDLDGQVFLSGYSEGGYATLLAQKAIEEDYSNVFNLVAVAPSAGPYDLKGMTDSIFLADTYSSPAYIAYFLTAYNEIYGWDRLDDFFKAPYAAKMPGLFDGSKTWGHIINQLPATFEELMNPTFISSYKNGNELEITNAIQENTLLDWAPQAPIHFFHGDADDIVPYQNVLTAMEKLNNNGAENIQLTTIPNGTHDTAGPASIFATIEWFQSMRGA